LSPALASVVQKMSSSGESSQVEAIKKGKQQSSSSTFFIVLDITNQT
jgi:hypothetical protein